MDTSTRGIAVIIIWIIGPRHDWATILHQKSTWGVQTLYLGENLYCDSSFICFAFSNKVWLLWNDQWSKLLIASVVIDSSTSAEQDILCWYGKNNNMNMKNTKSRMRSDLKRLIWWNTTQRNNQRLTLELGVTFAMIIYLNYSEYVMRGDARTLDHHLWLIVLMKETRRKRGIERWFGESFSVSKLMCKTVIPAVSSTESTGAAAGWLVGWLVVARTFAL